ncbi:MAG: hypothetical protein ABH854_04375 [Candidatus Diapherotrites archaeon]|nr:hypothetical protein [Candidatus Micrarchaeota archaeon]MBU1939821.1 hypothetical protein [Candidatus Micrarchaeota archaeon]
MPSHRIYLALFFFLLAVLPALVLAECGDGICEPGGVENSCICPDDCETCEGNVPDKTCWVYSCTVVSDVNACRQVSLDNCCGNDSCDSEENYGICPADCLPTSIEIEILSPAAGEYFMRGEGALIKARVTAEGRSAPSTDLIAKGGFGTLMLYNDGMHEDALGGDPIFANLFYVDTNFPAGKYPFTLSGTFMGVDGNTAGVLEINPYFSAGLETENTYNQGDEIPVSGTLMKRNRPVKMEFDVQILYRDETIFSGKGSSDTNGKFGTIYHSSLLDPPGEWLLRLSGSDDYNNLLEAEHSFEVSRAKSLSYLGFELVNTLSTSYRRESAMEFVLNLYDSKGAPAIGAEVYLATPLNEKIPLQEFTEGQYSGTYTIPYNFPTGNAKFEIRASKTEAGITQEGVKHIFTKIESTSINIEIQEPSELHYRIGDFMPVKLKISYPSGGLVSAARGTVKLAGSDILLEQTSLGIVQASYPVTEADTGVRTVFLRVEDDFGNTGLGETRVEISGTSVLYNIINSAPFVIGAVAIILGILAVIGLIAGMALLSRRMKNRKQELLELERKLQKEYFEQHAISREEYDEMLDKYETELKRIERKLQEGKK